MSTEHQDDRDPVLAELFDGAYFDPPPPEGWVERVLNEHSKVAKAKGTTGVVADGVEVEEVADAEVIPLAKHRTRRRTRMALAAAAAVAAVVLFGLLDVQQRGGESKIEYAGDPSSSLPMPPSPPEGGSYVAPSVLEGATVVLEQGNPVDEFGTSFWYSVSATGLEPGVSITVLCFDTNHKGPYLIGTAVVADDGTYTDPQLCESRHPEGELPVEYFTHSVRIEKEGSWYVTSEEHSWPIMLFDPTSQCESLDCFDYESAVSPSTCSNFSGGQPQSASTVDEDLAVTPALARERNDTASPLDGQVRYRILVDTDDGVVDLNERVGEENTYIDRTASFDGECPIFRYWHEPATTRNSPGRGSGPLHRPPKSIDLYCIDIAPTRPHLQLQQFPIRRVDLDMVGNMVLASRPERDLRLRQRASRPNRTNHAR